MTGICDALDLLDEIYYADRISYDDYSRLFDAIAALGAGECEIVEHYAASTRGEIGRERVKLSCGHIAERHSKFCQECGAKIQEAVKR